MAYEPYRIDPSYNPTATIDPHKKLLAAVVARSLLDLMSTDAKTFLEAHEWFFDNPRTPLPFFSFVFACEELDFNINEMRKELIRLIDIRKSQGFTLKIKNKKKKIQDEGKMIKKQFGPNSLLIQILKIREQQEIDFINDI